MRACVCLFVYVRACVCVCVFVLYPQQERQESSDDWLPLVWSKTEHDKGKSMEIKCKRNDSERTLKDSILHCSG